jgi:hypothetical protein
MTALHGIVTGVGSSAWAVGVVDDVAPAVGVAMFVLDPFVGADEATGS